MLDLTEIQQALARGYCHASNADKKVDSTLIFAMAAEVLSALQNSGAVANEPPTRPAVKLPTLEECYQSIPAPINAKDAAMFFAGVAECHKLIVSRQLQA